MSDTSRAVFLSYASQDSEAAKKICDALQAAGVEVWFDRSELRGGDAWDQKIRKQIKECALFVPIISANTQARAEGYFRLEWKLAVDRSHQMADDEPFLLPVVIDETTDAAARVPDKFREVQWTRLSLKDTPESLAARIGRLLQRGDDPEERGQATSDKGQAGYKGQAKTGQRQSRFSPLWAAAIVVGVVSLGVVGMMLKRSPGPGAAVAKPAAAGSEARRLMARARAMTIDKYNSTPADYAAAEGFLKQALALDQNDAEIWTFSSLFNTSIRTRGFDNASARREMARHDADRAVTLAPDSLAALFALGRAQRDFQPDLAEQTFKKILARDPNHAEAMTNLASIYDFSGRPEEAEPLFDRAFALDPSNRPLNRYITFLFHFHYRRFEDADRAIRQSISLQPSANSLGGLAMLLLTWKGDADAAAQALSSHEEIPRNETRIVWNTAMVHLCRRAPDEVLKILDQLTDEYIQDNWFAGPKAYFAGRAHALAGRTEAARVAWESALAITDGRLKTTPSSAPLHIMRGQLLAWLGRQDEALREAQVVMELQPNTNYWFGSPALIYAALGRPDEAVPLLEKCVAAVSRLNVGWPLTPALLRIDPLWDKIRDDPRFQKLAGSDVK